MPIDAIETHTFKAAPRLGGMPEMRGGELWVGACLRATLIGVKVEQHDDGSRPSMCDLVRAGQPFGACEVTAAADADAESIDFGTSSTAVASAGSSPTSWVAGWSP